MADSDKHVMRELLRSATKRRKKELDKARLATRVPLKDQKGRWDRLNTVLKMKDSEMAEILFDTLVHFLIITIRPYPSMSIGIRSIPGASALGYGYVAHCAFTQFRFNTS